MSSTPTSWSAPSADTCMEQMARTCTSADARSASAERLGFATGRSPTPWTHVGRRESSGDDRLDLRRFLPRAAPLCRVWRGGIVERAVTDRLVAYLELADRVCLVSEDIMAKTSEHPVGEPDTRADVLAALGLSSKTAGPRGQRRCIT